MKVTNGHWLKLDYILDIGHLYHHSSSFTYPFTFVCSCGFCANTAESSPHKPTCSSLFSSSTCASLVVERNAQKFVKRCVSYHVKQRQSCALFKIAQNVQTCASRPNGTQHKNLANDVVAPSIDSEQYCTNLEGLCNDMQASE